jgi:cellulose synthase/poly-beta-1,6-N-acetylglucosamine synthase-like glycosyltransferase
VVASLLTMAGYPLMLGLVALFVPASLLFLQAFAAACARPVREPVPVRHARVAVVIPAHNESAGIVRTLHSVRSQLRAGDRLLVVADNCDDDTAKVAAAAGAQVVERHEPLRRGKGYALDFGVRHLEPDPPDVAIVVDADCTLGADCLDWLVQTCLMTKRPAQALYLMHSPTGAGPMARLGELAWRVRNHVRPLGSLKLGLPCQLMGSGMAFPWDTARSAPLATHHIAEDLLLGLQLAERGHPPVFCPQARVDSEFPAVANLRAQRTRWEHGHLGVMASHGPRLLWSALVRGQPLLVAMALDLCVPPLTVLTVLLLAALAAAAALALAGGGMLCFGLAGAASLMLACGFLLSWWRFGRETVSMVELLSVPGYLLAKVPVYRLLFKGRTSEWVRTQRDDGAR